MNLTEQQRELQRVVCAALRSGGSVIIGARHFDAMMHRLIETDAAAQMRHSGAPEETTRKEWARAEQGFIDQWGSFLTRAEAHAIATRQGQIIRRCGGDDDTLYSENLY